MLQKCAEPLQQLGISSGKNLVLLLLQLHSPNQLRKSCQAYATALPCFRNLVHRCGVPSQAEILRQMENAHHFLCSPFSAIEQSELLAHRACIGRVLGEVGGGGANCAGGGQNSSAMAVVLFKCRERCLVAAGEMSESAKFGCLVRAWLSEQNLCLSEQLRAKCGREAAAFYTKMQRKIFHKQFPLICEPQNNPELAATAQIVVQNVGDERKKSKKEPTAETKAAKSQSVTLASASAPSQPTIFVTSKKRVKSAARLSEIKLKFTGSAKRGSNNSSTTTNANRNNGMNLKASRKSLTIFSTAGALHPIHFHHPAERLHLQ
ncbi:hypothetical protein GPALN_007938 [Globodera pallida]|nr:hypothetical protein GPALN_007938 [Globodera pallida]